VRRPARLPPLAGGTLPHPSSSDTHEAHDDTPGTAQEPLRVMLHIQVKPDTLAQVTALPDIQYLTVPILLTKNEEGAIPRRLGTGFVIAPGVIMSANHVIGVTPAEDELLGIPMIFPDGAVVFHQITNVYRDPAHDLAVGRVYSWPAQTFIAVEDQDVYNVEDGVASYEYSKTALAREPESVAAFLEISGRSHIGHIMRVLTQRDMFPAPTEVLELSFPVLEGASGAPVINRSTGKLVGVVTHNYAEELHPAQIDLYEEPDGVREERKFYLPYALAVGLPHIRAAIAASGLMPPVA